MELPPGIYEQIVNTQIGEALEPIARNLTQVTSLDPGDADAFLARYLSELIARALRAQKGDSPQQVDDQVRLVNRVIETLHDAVPAAFAGSEEVVETARLLLGIMQPPATPGPVQPVVRPEIPLSTSALLVNGRGQPRVGAEIARELASADRVDLLCAFIKWHGLRVLEQPLKEFIARSGRLRVITTTYMGATDRRAIDALVTLGAKVKVSYETRTTRLHAKAWIFERDSRYSTAYVGSSNLSRSALLDGLEWNVRVSGVEQPHILDTFSSTFADYWGDPSFEDYDPLRDGPRLDEAIAAERGGPTDLPIEITSLHVQPWPYQQEVLEQLDAERQLHNRWRNLVVMATGTGKTVVSALDYSRLRSSKLIDTLLFVAHREEILRQSLHTFRAVLRDGAFGELLLGGNRPNEWQHVFGSIQSLAQIDLANLDPSHFSMVIVDEFHHAEASTYERLLQHVKPRVLLGLTATPERADGQDVTRWFDGRISAELRLWEALERGLLSPFQYFGIHDDVALEGLSWKRGRYDTNELATVYTGDDARAMKIVQAINDKVPNIREMRALGFCVSVDHARYMAEYFNRHNIPALAVSADTPRDHRQRALRDLRDRKTNAVFAVDLFNEGIDVPEIDTVLFLRPTESATVFLQQLGRGLRLVDDKPCLTVLDFIGNQHAKFRFDLRYRALTGTNRRDLVRAIDHGFPYLPAGCHIELDRVAAGIVLDNIRRVLRRPWQELVSDLKHIGDVSLRDFLDQAGLELDDVYRGDLGWLELRRRAGFVKDSPVKEDKKLGRAFRRMLHINDGIRLEYIQRVASANAPPSTTAVNTRESRLLAMLHFALHGASQPITGKPDISVLWRSERRQELLDLVDALTDRADHVTYPTRMASRPLSVHGTYSRDEALAAFGLTNPGSVREGVKHIEGERADLLFVTLHKTEQHFSPTTMYADLAITPLLFQWESQGKTSISSQTGQRYIHHRELGSSVHLFIRESKTTTLGDAAPYLYAGSAVHVSHERDRPIRITWQLERELPAQFYQAAKAIAG
jgi:superfamily II DNA or RNA helicase/HKD family nuclease